MPHEQRRARRVAVSLPALIEAIGQPDVALHPTVQAVYQRVEADRSAVGQTGPGIVRDLSTNGAFIAGEPLPLMSRVRVGFELPGLKEPIRSTVLQANGDKIRLKFDQQPDRRSEIEQFLARTAPEALQAARAS